MLKRVIPFLRDLPLYTIFIGSCLISTSHISLDISPVHNIKTHTMPDEEMAFACTGAITNVLYDDSEAVTDGGIYIVQDWVDNQRFSITHSGNPGSVYFEIITPSGTSTRNRNNTPWESHRNTIEAGTYKINISIYENNNSGGTLCESLSYTITLSDEFIFDFDEQADDFGLDLTAIKDGGHAFADYDNDGDMDLLANTDDNSVFSRLYRNNGNSTFSDVTATIAPYMLTTVRERAAVWGDLNNDGHLDFLRNTSHSGGDSGLGSIEIYIQHPSSGIFGDGYGNTTPIRVGNTVSDDVDIGFHNTEGAGMFDFDGDGDLDIVFDNHQRGIDILRNNFVDHTTGLPVYPAHTNLLSYATPGSGVVLGLNQTSTDGDYGSVTDVDNDGWVDIFMRKRDQNDFFLNQGGTFTNGSDLADANNSNKGSVAMYDFDNDGDFDAFWTENGLNQVFRNDGSGTWTPLGAGGTTGIPTVFTGNPIDEVSCGDLDNDGDIDILLVGDNDLLLYINQINDPVFGKNVGTPMTFVLNTDFDFTISDGESTSMVDVDMDGDLDIYVNDNSAPNKLWINLLYNATTSEADKNYLFVEVNDDRSAFMQGGAVRPALGATVVLEDCDGNILSGLRELNGSTGHGTQDPHLIHFGLPDSPDFSYRVRVKYPNYNISSGELIRAEVVKWIRPSEETLFPVTITFGPGDLEVTCPLEICGDGIDNDFDGLLDCFDVDCSGVADLDNDNILEFCDIDDDNDGIPDSIENSVMLPGYIPDCTSDVEYDFSGSPSLVSGSGFQEGAAYLYEDVAPGVDAYITIEDLVNVTIPTLDDNSADATWFKPQSAFIASGIGERVYAQYLIAFTVANTSTPFVQSQLNLSFNDIDGNSDYAEESAVQSPTSYSYDLPTELTFGYEDYVIGSAGTTEYADVTNNFPQVNYYVRLVNVSEVRIRFGALTRTASASAGGRQHALQFYCPSNYLDPQTIALDFDEDGVSNKDDLDSDNDGIWDAVEAGHAEGLDFEGRISGAHTGSGANGLFDDVETSPDSDIINYTLSDSEISNDGIYDPYELDSDDDDCYDTQEAEVSDVDEDGIAGSGSAIVDANGIVIGITYSIPLNGDWQDPSFNQCGVCETATINPHIMYYRKSTKTLKSSSNIVESKLSENRKKSLVQNTVTKKE